MSNGMENFWNFQIPGKKENLERLTEIFEMSFRKFSVPFDFKPEFSGNLVEWNAPPDVCTQLQSVNGRQNCIDFWAKSFSTG